MRIISTYLIGSSIFLASCGVGHRLNKAAKQEVIDNAVLRTAHIGISIFDPSTRQYLYNYQGDRYFVPASNTKIPTCYAAMKYLGDSITGIRMMETDTAFYLYPTGDPTFLHPDFSVHRVFQRLKNTYKKLYVVDTGWDDERWGSGWSWNDYDQAYMAERSPLPIYGNVLQWTQERDDVTKPAIIYSLPEVNWEINFNASGRQNFRVDRDIDDNRFTLTEGRETKRDVFIPFVTGVSSAAVELLSDTLQKWIAVYPKSKTLPVRQSLTVVKSQAVDSLLMIMMHRSDNFFAEQSLLMVSNAVLGLMNDSKIIDTLLQSDFRDLPQKPRWADGSGLSRYNLFTPQDFIVILDKLRAEFGMERARVIFPTGGEGTISNYYKADSGYIYAKTGTLSGVVALSGYLYTKKGRLLIFSTLVNNHQASATDVRRAIEKFLQGIRENY